MPLADGARGGTVDFDLSNSQRENGAGFSPLQGKLVQINSPLRNRTKAILNLLKLSNPFNVPGADDLVPVLVFVIVKANPPSLLSTIQFVDTFEKVWNHFYYFFNL